MSPAPRVALAALLLAPLARATIDPVQPAPQLLLTRGSPAPGSTVGAVWALNDVDHGGPSWIASTTTGQILDLAVVDGVAGHTYAGLPAGAGVLSRFEASLDVNASGATSTVAIIEYPGLVFDVGVFVDDLLALPQGAALSGPGVPADATWAWFQGANLTDDDRLVVNGWVTHPADPGENHAVIASYDLLPGGTLAPAPTILRTEGELLEGKHRVEWLPANGDLGWEATASGHLMHVVGFEGEGFEAGPFGIVLDDAVLALDGEPSIVPGRDWKLDAWYDLVDVAEGGSWAFRTRVEGGFDGLEVLVHDGAVVAIEGSDVPGLPGTELRVIEGPRLSDDGKLAWYGRWTVDGEVGIWHSGLFLNDQLVIEEGMALSDGTAVSFVYGTARTYDLAPDGSALLVKVQRDDNEWGLYELALGPWVSQGGSLAGTGGLAPRLGGHGDQTPGSATTVSLYDALPSSTAHAILGLSELGIPHKGGVLCPSPDVLVLGIPVGGDGALQLPFAWPAGVPSGTPLWWQLWVEDPAAPKGVSATNCLRSTSP